MRSTSYNNVYVNGNGMFISVELASDRIQLSLLAPQFFHGGGSTRTETAIRLTGMMVLASSCGDTNVDLINCSY
jgi:hypothetical protein